MTKLPPVNAFNKQEVTNLALEYIKEAVFVFDDLGAILYANPPGARFFGLRADELIGKGLQNFLKRIKGATLGRVQIRVDFVAHLNLTMEQEAF